MSPGWRLLATGRDGRAPAGDGPGREGKTKLKIQLLAPFFESASLANKQTTTRVQPLKARRSCFSLLARCVALIHEVESTKTEVALSERSNGPDAEHGLFATETYRALRCRSRR
jgi:hypothetical protein